MGKTSIPTEYHLSAATLDDLDAISDLEQLAYPLPWGRGLFVDVLTQPQLYLVQLVWAHPPTAIPPAQPGTNAHQSPSAPPPLAGYFVGLRGYEEIHLLNLAVHPHYQRQGCAALLLHQLHLWARSVQAQQIILEVRAHNHRAQHVYQRFGFEHIGTRKGYYPAPDGGREDAHVMRLGMEHHPENAAEEPLRSVL